MKENYRSGMTGISVLMVFLILCIAVFAMLTLSSAQSQWVLTQKNQTQIDTYYACDAQAQRMLSQLDILLESGSGNIESTLEGTPYSIQGDTITFETEPINQRKMVVSATFTEDGRFTIADYRLINTEDIEYESGLDVYIPE